ncbi:MAG: MarR family transcriptional regulator [Candidatus Saccharibacteria bacterium]|nr:MarR family transcriptional regulator [Candidatus Saccharibacteria bacterium]
MVTGTETTNIVATCLHDLFKSMRRPQVWSAVTKQAGVDIDRPGFSLLAVLYHTEKGSWKLHDIAAALGVEAPSVTRKAQQLERDGLVMRVPDDKDGRAVRLRLTEAGAAIHHKIKAVQMALYEQALSGWSDHDKQTLAQLMERMTSDIASAQDTFAKD